MFCFVDCFPKKKSSVQDRAAQVVSCGDISSPDYSGTLQRVEEEEEEELDDLEDIFSSKSVVPSTVERRRAPHTKLKDEGLYVD